MRKHKNSDFLLILITMSLLIIGLVVIYAISPSRVNYQNAAFGWSLDQGYYFWHQLMSVGLAAVAFFVAYKLPYKWVSRSAIFVLILGFVLSFALFLLGKSGSSIANCTNGACRWMNIGPVSVQPVELIKIGLVLYLAKLTAARKKEGMIDKIEYLVPFFIMSAVALVFAVILQRDLGSGIVLVGIIMATFAMSGVKWWKVAGVVGAILVFAVFAILTSPVRMERVQTFLNSDGANSYHIEHAMIAMGSGGLFGVGIGNSVEATGYLPESINDSVFAVMGETFGFFGLLIVILLFLALVLRIFRAGKGIEIEGKNIRGMSEEEQLEREEKKFICIGVGAWILVQAAVNMGAMTGVIPLTGITLPLLSYGGTSMIITAVALGIVTKISKEAE